VTQAKNSATELKAWVIGTSITVIISVVAGVFTHVTAIADLKSRVSILKSIQAIQLENMSDKINKIETVLNDVQEQLRIIAQSN